MKKAIVFVDANNWYHNIKRLKLIPSDIDIVKLSNFLCTVKKYELVQIIWYASTPSIEDGESMYYRHMAFLDHLEKRRVKVVTRKLQRLSHDEILKKKKSMINDIDFCNKCKPLVESAFLDLADIKRKEKKERNTNEMFEGIQRCQARCEVNG